MRSFFFSSYCRDIGRTFVVMADDVVDMRFCRYSSRQLGPTQVYFRPALIWQQILDDHCVDAGLDLKVDMTTGVKMARFVSVGMHAHAPILLVIVHQRCSR